MAEPKINFIGFNMRLHGWRHTKKIFFGHFPNANNPDSSKISWKQPGGTEYGIRILLALGLYLTCIGIMRRFESVQFYQFH